MKITSLTFGLLAALAAASPCAFATSITYTYTATNASDSTLGTSFTYVDPAGFLSFDTGILAPTTASDLFVFGNDFGQLTGFDFVSSTEIKFIAKGGSLDSTYGSPAYEISSVTSGEHLPFTGSLAITSTAAAVTPEPSSLVLLGTGMLGAVGAVRRRLRRA